MESTIKKEKMTSICPTYSFKRQHSVGPGLKQELDVKSEFPNAHIPNVALNFDGQKCFTSVLQPKSINCNKEYF